MKLKINGKDCHIQSDPSTPLLWVLRNELKLCGTKFGCGAGLCGACTVHLDGIAIRSCSVPVSAIQAQEITTIEGLDPQGQHPLQQAWIANQVPQCGYCQPGQIMQAASLLSQTVNPSEDQIVEGMSGNICRCGTYLRIRKAIKEAAQAIAKKE